MHRTPKNETRKIRGMAIMSVEPSIKRINKLHYKVKSQSSDIKWYDIVKKYWTQQRMGVIVGKSITPTFQTS